VVLTQGLGIPAVHSSIFASSPLWGRPRFGRDADAYGPQVLWPTTVFRAAPLVACVVNPKRG